MKKLMWAILLLAFATPVQAGIDYPEYDRKDWPHWSAGDTWGDKLDTRQELLVETSLVPVTMECKRRRCYVTSGRWLDFYTGVEIVASSKKEVERLVTIEHLLTLYEAHYSGGAWWPRWLKKQFANDKRFLVVVSRSTNSARAGRDIFLPDYLPCRYVDMYVRAKSDYGLFFDMAEALFYAEEFEKCGGDPTSVRGVDH